MTTKFSLLRLAAVAAAAGQPSLPACAIPCLAAFVGSTADTDTALAVPDLCRAPRPSAATQACLVQHCAPADALDTVRVVAAACAWPVRSRKASLVALLAIQIPALVCLGLRLYGRARQQQLQRPPHRKRYAVDDYLSMAVAPLFAAFLVVGQYASVAAFGVDVWTVRDGQIAAGMRAFYIDEMLYLAILALVRLSILFLYLRLFAPPAADAEAVRVSDRPPSWSAAKTAAAPPESPVADQSRHRHRHRHRYRTVYYYRFRIAVYAVAAVLVVVPTVVFLVLDAVQCRPVSTVWTRWTATASAASVAATTTCLDVRALAYVAAAFGIVQDVAVLVMPWPLLFVLRRALFPSLRSAAALTAAAMFSLGVFVLITSCIRLHFLVHFSPTTTTNPTWDNTDSLVWSGLEVSVSVIVASLPTVRVLVQTAYRNRQAV